MNYKRKSRRRFFLLMRSRTPPPRYATAYSQLSWCAGMCKISLCTHFCFTLSNNFRSQIRAGSADCSSCFPECVKLWYGTRQPCSSYLSIKSCQKLHQYETTGIFVWWGTVTAELQSVPLKTGPLAQRNQIRGPVFSGTFYIMQAYVSVLRKMIK